MIAGALCGIFLIAVGTGGIKPCVSAHGGDQFLNTSKEGLNRFYNYFYLSINIGAIASNYAAPAVTELECFGEEKGTGMRLMSRELLLLGLRYVWISYDARLASVYGWKAYLYHRSTLSSIPTMDRR